MTPSIRTVCSILVLLGMVLTLSTSAAVAASPPAPLIDALQRGGYALLLRHGAVGAIVDEPIPLDLADCSVQRMLSEEGRDQARRIGEAFRSLNIPVGDVLSSGYCRTVYTAILAFGRTQAEEALLARDYAPVPGAPAPPEFERRLDLVRQFLATTPASGTNTVLVTHGEVIRGAVGFEMAMGEAAIFQRDGQGGFALVARVLADEWGTGAPEVDAGVLWVTNTATNDVAVFDAATGQLLGTIPLGRTPTGIVATAEKAYVAEGDNRIAIIAKSTMSVVDRLPTAARPHHMTLSADGRFVHVGFFGTNQVAVIETETDLLVEFATGAAEARSHQVAATLDGTMLLVANAQVNEVAALDAASGELLWTLPVGTNPSEVLAFADDKMAVVSIRNEDKLQIIDLTNPLVVAEVPVGTQPDTLALTPDDNWLIVGLRGSPASVAMVDVKHGFAVEWVSLEGTTTGHNTVSSSGRFSLVVVEGPSAGVAVIDHQTRQAVAYHAYPGGGRPHGIFYEP